MPQLSLDPFCLSEPVRSQKDKCQLCLQSFGITMREHLCKRCFRFVCDKCAPHKLRVYKADMQHRLHRMCKQCYTESQILRKYVQNNKLAWGQDSDMSRLWSKQLGRQPNTRASINLSKGTKQGGKGRQSFEATPNQVWSSLNYSFRQLIGMSIDRNKQLQSEAQQSAKRQKNKNISQELHKIVTAQIMQLLSTIVNSINNPSVQPQNILYILMFFLAHASPSNALSFTKSIIQFLSFQQPSVETIAFYLQKLQCSDIQTYKMENYIEGAISKIASTATINYFSAEVSIQIVSAIISKKTYDDLERGIAYTISKRKQFIIKNINKPQLIIPDLLRNNQGLGDGYKKFVKLCQSEQNQDQIAGIRNPSKRNSDSTKSIIRTQQYYNSLIKENEELKIKNKNQQQQIVRLKAQNNRLSTNEKRRKSRLSGEKWDNERKNSILKQNNNNDNSMDIAEIDDLDSQNSWESYWEETSNYSQQQIDKNILNQEDSLKSNNIHTKMKQMIESQLPSQFTEQKNYDKMIKQLSQKIKTKSKGQQCGQKIYRWEYRNGKNVKLVKKYRKKTQGERKMKKMTTMSQKLVKQVNNFNKRSDQKLTKEGKLKYDKMVDMKNEQISKLNKQVKMLKQSTDISYEKQNKQLKAELIKVKQMNKGLLVKMSQLSVMLMDKEEEQVNQSRESLQEIMQLYQQQAKAEGESCCIF